MLHKKAEALDEENHIIELAYNIIILTQFDHPHWVSYRIIRVIVHLVEKSLFKMSDFA